MWMSSVQASQDQATGPSTLRHTEHLEVGQTMPFIQWPLSFMVINHAVPLKWMDAQLLQALQECRRWQNESGPATCDNWLILNELNFEINASNTFIVNEMLTQPYIFDFIFDIFPFPQKCKLDRILTGLVSLVLLTTNRYFKRWFAPTSHPHFYIISPFNKFAQAFK